jgi:hypothetical protein
MDSDKQTKNEDEGEEQPPASLQRYSTNAGSILQSVWVRCRTIFPTATDRKFMESELRFVLYCGIVFWALYLLYEVNK